MGQGATRRPRVTLRAVAERAGVSMTTASFVLSGRRDMRISAATEERVQQAARVLGFTPRTTQRVSAARSAVGIGVISDAIGTESFAGQLLRGCVTAASEHGRTVLIAESEGDPALEAAAVEDFLERGVERFVYATTGTRACRLPPALGGKPAVLLNCFERRGTRLAVIPNERAAGRAAVAVLLERGHTDRIQLVGEVPPGAFAGSERLDGITTELAAAGLSLADHVPCVWWPPDARAAVYPLLTQPAAGDRPSALIAINDRVAMGIYQAAAVAGLRIPDQLSVVSFDGSDLARWLHPGLTSLALPYLEMGRRAIELLLADPAAGQRRVHRVPMPVQDRDSISAPGT